MTFRLVLYILAIVFSIAAAGRFATIHNRLARAVLFMTVAWAVNATLLLVMLAWSMLTGEQLPSWRHPALTVNAILIAVAPLALYLFLPSAEDG